jgi:hypothetical protein
LADVKTGLSSSGSSVFGSGAGVEIFLGFGGGGVGFALAPPSPAPPFIQTTLGPSGFFVSWLQ